MRKVTSRRCVWITARHDDQPFNNEDPVRLPQEISRIGGARSARTGNRFIETP